MPRLGLSTSPSYPLRTSVTRARMKLGGPVTGRARVGGTQCAGTVRTSGGHSKARGVGARTEIGRDWMLEHASQSASHLPPPPPRTPPMSKFAPSTSRQLALRGH
eukprot:760264-Hanusia_phi.AAC.4